MIAAYRRVGSIAVTQTWNGSLGTWNAATEGLGGWTLNQHHFYDVQGRVLHFGGGGKLSIAGTGTIITAVAGQWGCSGGPTGDGGPATKACVIPWGIALSPDGTIYIADPGNRRIRRVGPDGIISTVVGTGTQGYGGDGGPATQALLNGPSGVAVGPDGSIYIADTNNFSIRRVGPDGIITTVAGSGAQGYGGDGGPATQALLNGPSGVAVGPDGSIYIADTNSFSIRRVGPDGIITTVAGTGTDGYGGDGGPATQAMLSLPVGVALGRDGSLFIADTNNNRIRKVGPDGIITTVAGNTTPGFYGGGYSGDGGLATQAWLNQPSGVAVGPDGSIYIADTQNGRIRRVGPDGYITTFAGRTRMYGEPQYSGDDGPATQAVLDYAAGVTVGPDGSIYIADATLRRVHSPLPGLSTAEIPVPSEDGRAVYIFQGSGRHLSTLNALTGTTLYQFGYDAQGTLATVTDGDGNTATIERDTSGNATAIVGPYGQKTVLTLDTNGYLASVTNPAGETTRMGYTSDGLLTTFTTPRGYASQYIYDSLGNLTQDQDAAGGSKTLVRTSTSNGYQVTSTTALGQVTTYQVEHLSTGGTSRTVTSPDGTQVTSVIGTDGTTRNTYPNGTVETVTLGPDPRWGMLAPLTTTRTVAYPRDRPPPPR